MTKGILGEYGPESKPGGRRAECGGVTMKDKKDLPYSMPQGPKGQMHQGPGLGQNNYGNCGTQGKGNQRIGSSGRAGIGGENRGKSGTQGKR